MAETLFPKEVISKVPYLTITGNAEAHIEQHRGLMTCLEEEVSFQTNVGILSIRGSQLCVYQYSLEEASVTGRITAVCIGEGSIRK